MTDPDIIQSIKEGFQAVAGMLGTGGGGGGTTGNSAGSSGVKGISDGVVQNIITKFDKTAEAITPLVFGFNRLTTGTDAAGTALNLFKAGLGAVNLGALGNVAQLTVGSVLDWKTQMDAASKEMGIGGNNIGLFVKMAGDAGVTTKQFADIVAKTGVQSLGLGANAQKGAEAFSAIASEVRQSPIGQQLQDLGMSTEELASITAVSALQTRGFAKDSKEAATAAIELAAQLDETSRLTGVSREQMAKDLASDEKRASVRALENLLSADQKEGYIKTKKAAEMFGDGMVQLTSELASGKLSKEGAAQLSLLGDAGREYEAALKQQMAARSGPEKAAADAALELAQGHVAAKLASTELSATATYASGALGKSALSMIDSNKGMENVQKAAAEFQKKGMSEQDAYVAVLKKNKEDAANARQGKDEKGKDDEGQNSARLLNEANRNAAIQAAGLATNFKQLNDGIKPGSKIYEILTGATKYTGTDKDTAAAATAQPKVVEKVVEEIKGSGAKPTAAPPSKDLDKDGNPLPYKSTRDGGTLAKTGSPVEPEDAIVKIHKGETVLSPDATKGMGKQLSEGSKAAPSASETATAISSVPAATGSAKNKAEESASNEDTQKWIAIFKERSDLKLSLEKENAAKDIESATQRLARRQNVLADLQETASKRELTEQEKADMKMAENGIRRANNNIANDQARLAAVESLEKQGYTKTIESKKSEIAEVTKHEEAKKSATASVKAAEIAEVTKHEEAKKSATVTQQAFSAMATLGLTENQKKMFGDFYNLSKEDSEKKKASLAEEAASALEANKAAAAARDAIEEKAELEGRKMTESEEAQYKALGTEINASAKKIDAARDAQKVLERADQERVSQAKIAAFQEQNLKEAAAMRSTQATKESADQQQNIHAQAAARIGEITSQGAKAQEGIQKDAASKATASVKETLTINGKAVDPNSPEGKEAMSKIQEGQAKMKEAMGNMLPDLDKMMGGGGTLTVNGKEVDSNNREGSDALGKINEAKATMAKSLGGMLDMPGDKLPSKEEVMRQFYLGRETTLNEKDSDRPEIKPIEKIYSSYDEAKKAGMENMFKNMDPKALASLASTGSGDTAKQAQEFIAKQQAETKAAEAKKTGEATPKEDTTRTIKSGDTLSKIAKDAGVSIAEIMKANPDIKDPNKIKAGATLNIPGKKTEEAKAKEPEKKAETVDALASKKEEAKVKESDTKKPEPSDATAKKTEEAKTKTSTLGSMFAPKIIDQAAADIQKAKIAEANAAEAKKTSEAVPKKTVADKAKEEEEKKKNNPAELKEGDQKKASANTHDATLKDLNDQLILLNKHMIELINHSEKSADANAKTAKATQRATGVR